MVQISIFFFSKTMIFVMYLKNYAVIETKQVVVFLEKNNKKRLSQKNSLFCY